MGDEPLQLVVFADDWGRHPSSAQHLVRAIASAREASDVVWINTVGTRRPRLTAGDVRRALQVVRAKPQAAEARPPGLRVFAPMMYPGFRADWQRRLNAALMTRAVEAALQRDAGSRVAVTTLPITADLVGRLPGVRRWVYYCVDDFSVWPGLDGNVMDAMERQLVATVDAVVAVSETLVERMRSMGRSDVTLLTHGVDLKHWRRAADPPPEQTWWPIGSFRTALFWGLIDERMDHRWCACLKSVGPPLHIHLCGPVDDKTWRGLGETTHGYTTARPYAELPELAAAADVLIMPYVDAPVTRAMQPLKLKEYLATFKPAVVRDLPATREWADCCDVVATAEEFARVCLERAKSGLPDSQRAARERRLPAESWAAKARTFAQVLRGA